MEQAGVEFGAAVPNQSPHSVLKFIGGNASRLRPKQHKDSIFTGESGINYEHKITPTSTDQEKTEMLVLHCVEELEAHLKADQSLPVLRREKHINYLLASMKHLPSTYQFLDASGAWLCYWMVNAINLLGIDLSSSLKRQFIKFLKQCEDAEGGYGGGYMQTPHLATTYAAVSCLLSLGTQEAFDSINLKTLLNFLTRMHQPDGSYIMHDGGEVDLRGSYCALSVAKSLNIFEKELTENCVDFILQCQTYEGGFGALPGLEAHGGYSYCGIAALALLEAEDRCDLQKLLNWMVMRQCPFEGGFNGRTNKLVDGCYSFWLGGAFPIVYRALSRNPDYVAALPVNNWIFNSTALQEYILTCCQFHKGGLIDKPERRPDFYHTCYVISGLSIAQHFTQSSVRTPTVVGKLSNEVEETNALFNIRQDCLITAMNYFLSAGRSK